MARLNVCVRVCVDFSCSRTAWVHPDNSECCSFIIYSKHEKCAHPHSLQHFLRDSMYVPVIDKADCITSTSAELTIP